MTWCIFLPNILFANRNLYTARNQWTVTTTRPTKIGSTHTHTPTFAGEKEKERVCWKERAKLQFGVRYKKLVFIVISFLAFIALAASLRWRFPQNTPLFLAELPLSFWPNSPSLSGQLLWFCLERVRQLMFEH